MSIGLGHVIVSTTLLLLLASALPALAQKVTTVDNLTAEQVLVQLANAVSTRPTGQTIALTAAAEIATTPFMLSSGGFEFKLDPKTGLFEKTNATFGPSMIDRAATAGEGAVVIGASFMSTTYDQLSGLPLTSLPFATVTATSPANSRTLTGNLSLSAKTVAISGLVGLTPNLDVSVIVPLHSVKLAGSSTLVNGTGVVARVAETDTAFSGLGDMAVQAKYRFLKFENPAVPDAGGMALGVNVRLPTGDRENLRGLGVTRTLVSGVVSGVRGPFRPHGTAGFDYWSKSVEVGTDFGQSVSMQHRFQYGAGVEVFIPRAPKVTLMLEFLGQRIMGAGAVEVLPENAGPSLPGITSAESMVAVPDGIHKALLVPGLKVNIIGKMLLSLNVMFTLTNNGLRPRTTPVAGIFLTLK